NRIPGLSVVSIPFNQKRELMQDINIRKAIAHAIDRDAVISTAIGGEGIPAYDHVIETIPNSWSREEAKERAITHDVERARELLEESGWTNDEEGEVRTRDGEELSILYRAVDIGHYEETAVVVQPMLQNVGFEVEVEINEIGTYWDMMEEGNYDIKTAEHWAVANPQDVLVLSLSSDELTTPDGSVNYANVQNERVDELLDQAQYHPDPDERLAAVREVQEMYHENVWYHPLYGFTRSLCYEDRLTGTEEFFEHNLWGDQYYLDKLVFDLQEEGDE
ncbi:MAG: ABC transporter substrate-binding protein, partial [Haloferacaceae archaeon]